MIFRFSKLLSMMVATLLVSSVLAQASGHRPDTRYISCSSARALVQSRGAIVMSTGNFTYDKYVKNHAYCNLNTALRNAFVPTLDTRRCKVGFVCKDKIEYHD